METFTGLYFYLLIPPLGQTIFLYVVSGIIYYIISFTGVQVYRCIGVDKLIPKFIEALHKSVHTSIILL